MTRARQLDGNGQGVPRGAVNAASEDSVAPPADTLTCWAKQPEHFFTCVINVLLVLSPFEVS